MDSFGQNTRRLSRSLRSLAGARKWLRHFLIDPKQVPGGPRHHKQSFQNRINLIEQPDQPLDQSGADRRKFWAIQKVPDALESGSHGLAEKPFVGIGRCTECGIVYNSGSKKTNG